MDSGGGGAAAGIRDGDRMCDVVTRGNVARDRERIFPEAAEGDRPGATGEGGATKDEGKGI